MLNSPVLTVLDKHPLRQLTVTLSFTVFPVVRVIYSEKNTGKVVYGNAIDVI
jgi:hypothetical protein